MPRPGLVEWIECVARVHPTAIQRDRSRNPRKMERSFSAGWNPCLPAGVWISVFHLEQEDSKDLALRRMRNAHRHWPNDGNASLFPCHDRPQCGRLRARAVSRRGKTDQLTTSESFVT